MVINMRLIDKYALVAEIENRIKETQFMQPKFDQFWAGQISAFKGILKILDTLEVKEVDLETNIQDYIDSHFTEGCDGGMISDWYKVLGGVHYKDLKEIARHFFELGLKAQKGESYE